MELELCVIYSGSSPKQEMAAVVADTTIISSWMRAMTEQLPQWSKWLGCSPGMQEVSGLSPTCIISF